MKVAVITGSANGIGREFALQLFRKEKCCVVLVDLDIEGLRSLKRQLDGRSKAQWVEIFECDVSSNENVLAMTADLKRRRPLLTDIHFLFNNVGVGDWGTGVLFEGSIQRVRRQWDINYWSAIQMTRALLPFLMPSAIGSIAEEKPEKRYIVCTASIAGIASADSVYAITKHALVATVECMSRELHAKGLTPYIHCAALCPSFVATGILQNSQKIMGPLERPKQSSKTKKTLTSSTAPNMRMVVDNAISPEMAVRITLAALKRGEMYIHTHADWSEAVAKDRCHAILSGFRDQRQRAKVAMRRKVDRSEQIRHSMDLCKL